MATDFSAKRTAEIVGISYRQLDYWARTDLVRPSVSDARGSGSRRRYSYNDLVELKLVKKLKDAGIELPAIREVFQNLRESMGEDPASANLVLDGSQVLLKNDDELIDLVKTGQGVLNVVGLAGVKGEVDAAIVELHPDQEPAEAAGPRRATGS